MGFFKKKPQAFLGVDIGAGGVKVVELRSERGRARLSTYGLAEYPSMERSATSLGDDLGGLADALREVCARARVEATEAVCALPVAAVFSSVITLPRMAKKQLPDAVAWEAKKLLPLPYEEMITDWKLLTPEEDLETENTDTTTARVLLTAAPKQLVQQYITVFRGAGLELLSLETEAFALIRSLVGDDPAVVLLMDIGASRTSMVIVEDGTPMLSRSVDVGGRHLTRAMSDLMGIAVPAAEELKLDLAVTPTGNPAAAALPKLFERLFAPVIQEARYAMNLHQSQEVNNGRSVEKIILAGGSALLPSLTEYFGSTLNLRAFVGDPWARVVYPVDLRPALDTIGARFAVAVGLGMREIV
ncbi:MAG: type IV pilus assembly protein PilM [bacterium]|nr:type IV pilus assembly protein PilM [bacterium]